MDKRYLLALPVLALVASVGIAAAFPLTSTEDMTDQEKALRVQMLEMRQEVIGDQIAYLNGEITQEQLQDTLQTHLEEMQQIRDQLWETAGDGEGCPHAWGGMMGRGFGPGMMGI
jgi:hypothetical protein